MNDHYFQIARVVLYFCLLISVSLYGVIHYKKLKKPYHLLVILVLTSLISESFSRIFVYTMGSTIPPYHFLFVVTVFLQSTIYRNLTKLTKKENLALSLSTFFICGLSIINSIFFQKDLKIFPTNGIILLSLFTIILTLITFIKMINSPIITPLRKQPVFWLNTGNFIFYNLTFFVFAFFNHFYEGKWGPILIWGANLTMYTFYFLALKTGQKNNNE